MSWYIEVGHKVQLLCLLPLRLPGYRRVAEGRGTKWGISYQNSGRPYLTAAAANDDNLRLFSLHSFVRRPTTSLRICPLNSQQSFQRLTQWPQKLPRPRWYVPFSPRCQLRTYTQHSPHTGLHPHLLFTWSRKGYAVFVSTHIFT